MQKPKTYFEQIPIEVVRKIAELEWPANGVDGMKIAPEPTRFNGKPHRSPMVGKRRKASLTVHVISSEVNCSICHKPVELAIAKTDEYGRAVHEDCYLLKLVIESMDVKKSL